MERDLRAAFSTSIKSKTMARHLESQTKIIAKSALNADILPHTTIATST
jgi:hypothetical protein